MTEILTIVISLMGAAFFAGSETAFVYTDGKGASKGSSWWKSRMQRLLATTLVGTNISIILLSITASRVMHGFFGPKGAVLSVLIVSFVSLIFCEVVPKSLGLQFSTQFSNFSALPLMFFYRLFWPIIWFVESAARPLSHFFGLYFPTEGGLTDEDILHFVSSKGTDLPENKRKALAQVLLLENTPVYELMSPIAQLPMIEEDTPVEQVKKIMKEGRRNIAIVLGEDDMEKGFVQRNDIEMEGRVITRTSPVFPMTKPAGEVISDLSRQNLSAALIVDEQGSFAGIVTMRSLFSEMTGERAISPTTLRKEITVSAQIHIRHLSQALGIKLTRSRHYQTLGGLLTEEFGRIPKAGESIDLSGFRFTVLSATPTHLRLIRIDRIPS